MPTATNKLAVVVTARNELPHLWYTVQNLIAQITAAGLEEFVDIYVVDDGSTDKTPEYLNKYAVREHIAGVIIGKGSSPAGARDLGMRETTAPLVLFLDGHVLLHPDVLDNISYWQTCQPESFPKDWGSIHLPVAWDGATTYATHYQLTLGENFWGINTAERISDKSGFREIASLGHAGWLVNRAAYDKVGGFGLPFKGYAGEETYFSLKLGMFGYRNYIAYDWPLYHCSERSQEWKWTNEEVFINQVMGAFAVGGEQWSRPLYEHAVYNRKMWSYEVGTDLYDRAQAQALTHHHWVRKNAKFTLEEHLAALKARSALQ